MEGNATHQLKEQMVELKEAYARERHSAEHLAETALQTSKQSIEFVDEWARTNCWKLFGLMLGFGFLTGIFWIQSSRRRRIERVPR